MTEESSTKCPVQGLTCSRAADHATAVPLKVTAFNLQYPELEAPEGQAIVDFAQVWRCLYLARESPHVSRSIVGQRLFLR